MRHPKSPATPPARPKATQQLPSFPSNFSRAQYSYRWFATATANTAISILTLQPRTTSVSVTCFRLQRLVTGEASFLVRLANNHSTVQRRALCSLMPPQCLSNTRVFNCSTLEEVG